VTEWSGVAHGDSARNLQCQCRGLTLARLAPNEENFSVCGIYFCHINAIEAVQAVGES
jgi:hypothetical protein